MLSAIRAAAILLALYRLRLGYFIDFRKRINCQIWKEISGK